MASAIQLIEKCSYRIYISKCTHFVAVLLYEDNKVLKILIDR